MHKNQQCHSASLLQWFHINEITASGFRNSLSPFYGIRYSTSVIQLHKSLKISHHYIYQAYNIAVNILR